MNSLRIRFFHTIKPFSIILCAAVITGFGCWNKERPVAQVKDAVLIEAQVEMMVPHIGTDEEYRIAKERFVYDWVDLELLYQEADRNNVTSTPLIDFEVDRIRKTMIVNEFLKSQIDSFLVVSEKEINDYYNTKSRQLLAETNYFRFIGVKINDSKLAQQLRQETNQNTNIITAAKNISDKFQIVSNGIDFIPEYTLNNTLAAELLKNAGKKTIIIITINNEYYVVRPEAVIHQGEPKNLDMVKQEIEQQILFQKRHDKYEALLSRLRKTYSHEINLSVSSDSTKTTQGGTRAVK